MVERKMLFKNPGTARESDARGCDADGMVREASVNIDFTKGKILKFS